MVVRRVEALGKFLDTDDGKNLLAGTKRASEHPLRIEEKEGRASAFDGAPECGAILSSMKRRRSRKRSIK